MAIRYHRGCVMGRKRYKRIAWLIAHRRMWKDFPELLNEAYHDKHHRQTWKDIVEGFRDAGLVTVATPWAVIPMIDLVFSARLKLDGIKKKKKLLAKKKGA